MKIVEKWEEDTVHGIEGTGHRYSNNEKKHLEGIFVLVNSLLMLRFKSLEPLLENKCLINSKCQTLIVLP